jgi:hypothetical protein
MLSFRPNDHVIRRVARTNDVVQSWSPSWWFGRSHDLDSAVPQALEYHLRDTVDDKFPGPLLAI